MITIKTVTQQITEILGTDREGLKTSQETALKKKLAFLTQMKNYLESNQTEAFLEKEKDRLIHRLNLLKGDYPSLPDVDKKTEQAAIKEYEKNLGVPLLRLQIKTLRFILNS